MSTVQARGDRKKRGERDHLFLNGSIWWMRFQRTGPDGKPVRIERSLKTSNKLEALASEDFKRENAAHIAWKLSRQQSLRLEQAWQPELADGMHVIGECEMPAGHWDGAPGLPSCTCAICKTRAIGGLKIFAAERKLHVFGPKDVTLAKWDNGGLVADFAGPWPDASTTRGQRIIEAAFHSADPKFARPKPVRRDSDPDQPIWDAYLDHGGKNKTGVQGKAARDATVVWQRFREFAKNKPLKQCTRVDGRAFVAHLLETPNPVNGKKPKSASVARGLRPLAAAVNLAIGDGVLELNPFVSVVPDRGDSIEREAFTDADCELIKSRLGELRETDQLLVRLLATTGMRLDEPFQAKREYQQDGIRYIHVGTKTEASNRKLPLPAGILEYLPNKVTKPLFDEPSKKMGARLRLWLRRLGFDRTKTLHSFRHRAGARLTKLKCPSNVRRLILGHAKDVSEEYGKSDPPFELLKEWVDQIGF
jgi:integrase